MAGFCAGCERRREAAGGAVIFVGCAAAARHGCFLLLYLTSSFYYLHCHCIKARALLCGSEVGMIDVIVFCKNVSYQNKSNDDTLLTQSVPDAEVSACFPSTMKHHINKKRAGQRSNA